MSSSNIDYLNPEQREEAAAWLAEQIKSAPEFFRPVLASMLVSLGAGQLSKKQFNTFSRQLGRALGVIPSSEKRKSGDPLGALKVGATGKPKSERERLEQERDRSNALMDRHGDLKRKHWTTMNRLNERLSKMADEPDKSVSEDLLADLSVDDIELSEEAKAESMGAGMVLVIGLQVFFRYALNDSLFWSEELGRMCLVWLTFIGATVAYRRGAHIGVDVLTARLGPVARRAAAVLALVASLAFFLASAWGGWKLFGLLGFQTMPALGLSKQVPFAVVPFSFMVLTVHGLCLLLEELTGSRLPGDKP